MINIFFLIFIIVKFKFVMIKIFFLFKPNILVFHNKKKIHVYKGDIFVLKKF